MKQSLELVLEGLEYGDRRAVLKGLNEYLLGLSRPGVRTLDDITGQTTTEALQRVFGFQGQRPNAFRAKLVEIGVLSERIEDYDPLEQHFILERVLEKVDREERVLSSYFTPTLEAETLEENRRVLASSDDFRHYLRRRGVYTLDDLDRNHATQPLGKVLGFKRNSTSQMVGSLVRYGTFSLDLEDYGGTEREMVAYTELFVDRGRKISVYVSDSVEPSIRENNRRIISQTHTFKRYFHERGLYTLDDINGKTSPRLQTTLGIRDGSPNVLRAALVRLGVHPTRISEYNPALRERIARNIIRHSSGQNWQSSYFSLELSDDLRTENLSILLQTNTVRDFLEEERAYGICPKDASRKAKNFFRKVGMLKRGSAGERSGVYVLHPPEAPR